MQGFRADIFTGGRNESKHPRDVTFIGLRERWDEDSVSLIRDLARLWNDQSTRTELVRISSRFPSAELQRLGSQPAVALLRKSGVPGAIIFADTLEAFRGDRVARKTNAMIRSYVQNAHLLARHECRFRTYLQNVLPEGDFPPQDVINAEAVWPMHLQQHFYNVCRALANYLFHSALNGLK